MGRSVEDLERAIENYWAAKGGQLSVHATLQSTTKEEVSGAAD